jgi:hypothetical protein
VYVLVIGLPFWPYRPFVEPTSVPNVCQTDHYVIQIHGTMSTGWFQPGPRIVNDLDPDHPDVGIFDVSVGSNDELQYLFGVAADCVLTFSFDDTYLTRNGTQKKGVYAWNAITSPWARQPDELANALQSLMNAYPNSTFDIVAYSAGGIVPTYWAVRDGTSDDQRAHVRSIDVLDGVVSGTDVGLLDLACLLPRSLRSAPIFDLGPLPCQFRFDGEFTRAIRDSLRWNNSRLATVRARGDLVVWYDVAGLPGRAVWDEDLRAVGCAWWEVPHYGIPGCILKTHGSVLNDLEGARHAIDYMIGPRQ